MCQISTGSRNEKDGISFLFRAWAAGGELNLNELGITRFNPPCPRTLPLVQSTEQFCTLVPELLYYWVLHLHYYQSIFLLFRGLITVEKVLEAGRFSIDGL